MWYWKKVILSGGKFLNQFGDILQNIAPVIPCDATVTMMQTMGKGSQNEIWRVEGSNPSVSRYLCAIYYYEQLSSSVPWWYILQALSPLVYYLLLERKRVVKNEILEIFKAACCWSVNLYYGKSEGQWARCLNLAETWVNSNLLKLFDRKTVMKSSPLGYF